MDNDFQLSCFGKVCFVTTIEKKPASLYIKLCKIAWDKALASRNLQLILVFSFVSECSSLGGARLSFNFFFSVNPWSFLASPLITHPLFLVIKSNSLGQSSSFLLHPSVLLSLSEHKVIHRLRETFTKKMIRKTKLIREKA